MECVITGPPHIGEKKGSGMAQLASGSFFLTLCHLDARCRSYVLHLLSYYHPIQKQGRVAPPEFVRVFGASPLLGPPNSLLSPFSSFPNPTAPPRPPPQLTHRRTHRNASPTPQQVAEPAAQGSAAASVLVRTALTNPPARPPLPPTDPPRLLPGGGRGGGEGEGAQTPQPPLRHPRRAPQPPLPRQAPQPQP